jgi:hypothetical protein
VSLFSGGNTFPLPDVGDIQGQATSGLGLINQLEQFDPQNPDMGLVSSMLEAGIALIGGAGATVLTDEIGGAMSGFAMAGPCGAVAGALLGAAEGIAALFSGADAVTGVYGVSKATQIITSRVAALAGRNSVTLTGNPQGWAMADYCAFAFPPSTSKNANGFMVAMKDVATYYASYWDIGAAEATGGTSMFQNSNGDPNNLANALCGSGVLGSIQCNSYTAAQFLGWQVPLCTPVWFNWYQSQAIQSCKQYVYFGSGGACPAIPGIVCGPSGASPAQLKSAWEQTTQAQAGYTQAQIVAMAISKLPDRFYWSSDLYGTVLPSGFNGWQTVLYNPDLMNAVATMLLMRSSGASTQALVSELLIQSGILSASGKTTPAGNPMPGNVAFNQYGFHRFVDDHIRMANAENAAANKAEAAIFASSSTSTGVPLSTAGMLGAVTAGVTGTILAGILGYSAYTRTSPLVVTRNAYGRVVQAGGKVRRLF